MQGSLELTDSVEQEDLNSTMLGQEDFRIPEYMAEAVDDGDDEAHDDDDEDAFPYRLEDCYPPTFRKSTFHHYCWGVDEEDRW